MERGSAPTLYAHYAGGRLRWLGELWSVGDILAKGRQSPCQLAFLSAYQAGVAGGKSAYIDEYGGLPAALRLGGVVSVVCSLWEVEEGFTALYADKFYARLPPGGRTQWPWCLLAFTEAPRLPAPSRAHRTRAMNGGAVAEATKDLGVRFRFVSLLPVAVLGLGWSSAPGRSPDLRAEIAHARHVAGWAAFLLALTAVIVALIAEPLQMGIAMQIWSDLAAADGDLRD